MLVVWIPYMYEWQEYYVCEFALPRIAERYGFEFGTVSFSRENVTYAWPGIVSVDPDGELARIGVRRRDMPFEYHGNGATALYSALMAAERGHVAVFEVVNADDWSAGRDQQAFRMIQVRPRSPAR